MKKIFITCMMFCIANVCFAHSENNLSAKDALENIKDFTKMM